MPGKCQAVFEAHAGVDLERLTKPLNVSPTDEYAGKQEKCLVDIGTALVADA